MTVIVCNLQAHAVTHYDWKFECLSERHAAGPCGLVSLGGEDDGGRPIEALVHTPVTAHGTPFKKGISAAYVTAHQGGAQALQLLVHTPGQQHYWYTAGSQMDGVAKVAVGRGIQECLLGFGLRNVDGQDFEVAHIEVLLAASKNRRV